MVIFLFFTAILLLGVAFVLWRRRQAARWISSLIVLLLATAVWSSGYALEINAATLPAKLLWAKVQYAGIVTVPLAWFAFAWYYTGRAKQATRRRLVKLYTFPIITLLLTFTNERHHLIWSQTRLVDAGPYVLLVVEHGRWFWVHSAFSYVVIIIGTVALLLAFGRFPTAYRWQVSILLFASMAPLLGNALYLLGLSPVTQLDLTAPGFAIGALLITWGIFSFHLFDLIPVARRVVVDSMSDGVLVLDRQDRIVDINPAAQTIIGRQAINVIGMHVEQLLTERPDLVASYGDVIRANAEITVTRDDSPYHYGLRISPIYDQRDQLCGRLIVLRDVTERKRVEAELHAQKRLFQNLVTVAGVMARDPNLENVLQNAVEVATTLTGAERGSLLLLDETRGVKHSILSQDWTTIGQRQSILKRVMSEGLAGWVTRHCQPALINDTVDDERWLVLPNEPYTTRSVIGIPIICQNDVLGVLILQHPLPDYFHAESVGLMQAAADQMALVLRNAQIYESIKEERGRLHTLIQSSRDGIVLVSMNRRVLVINQTALEFLQLPGPPASWFDKPVGDVVKLLRRSAPAAVKTMAAEMRRVQTGDEPAAEGEHEIPPRIIRWLNLPVTAEGNATGRLIVLRNVTDERLLDRLRQDLTNTTVHDLRNPIAAVHSALQLLEEDIGETLSPDAKRVLQIAQRSINKALHLVNTMMDISRLESRQMPLDNTLFPIHVLVTDLLKTQAPLAKKKGIRLQWDEPHSLPPVWADAGLIERVLQNLVGNAIKFTPAGGLVSITAERSETATNAELHVSVSDTGTGIQPEIQGRLFQKFTTGRHKKAGSGLGLAFCKMVVEAHGCRIWVADTSEKGTTITFSLPLPPNNDEC